MPGFVPASAVQAPPVKAGSGRAYYIALGAPRGAEPGWAVMFDREGDAM
jgi:hypothetical protein